MRYLNNRGRNQRLFVTFHGTGGNLYSLYFLTEELDAKAGVLSFLGEKGVGVNRRYFNPLVNQELDREDFTHQVSRFLQLWDSLEITASEIVAIGYSNGANLLQGILSQRPDFADQVILLHPSDFKIDFTPSSKPKRLLVTAGSLDTLVSPGDSMQLVKRLQSAFPDTQLELLDGGHGVSDAEIETVKKWLNT